MKDQQNNLETGENIDNNLKNSLEGKKKLILKSNKDIESEMQTIETK